MDEVPDHAHCRVCGKAIATGDVTCGPVCARKRTEALQRRQRLTYAFYGIALILVLLLLYGSHL